MSGTNGRYVTNVFVLSDVRVLFTGEGAGRQPRHSP